MLDVPGLMQQLAVARPVFHSEADFQHELAWLIHTLYPSSRIRLERPIAGEPGKRARLDLLVEIDGEVDAIELKYQTLALNVAIDGEEFSLGNKGAEDNLGYDFLKDLVRVERIAEAMPNAVGHAILLSNEPVWSLKPRDGEFNKDAFWIHDGRELSGTLSWREPARAKERAAAHSLRGSYSTVWTDYSELEGRCGLFRYLWLRADPDGWAH